ncbi:hypothetical protein GCM10010403_40780 [Glycomyces rutgersensis]|uniref:Uncharacterized protein n=1 Tax=Glycomyces rutgersensis TaxID=58115 RepID=A0ABN3G3T5_9ACTN
MSLAAARDLASRLAYDVIAAYARHGFTVRDMEFDPIEQAIWTALARGAGSATRKRERGPRQSFMTFPAQ